VPEPCSSAFPEVFESVDLDELPGDADAFGDAPGDAFGEDFGRRRLWGRDSEKPTAWAMVSGSASGSAWVLRLAWGWVLALASESR